MKIREAKLGELNEIAKIMLKEFSKPPFNENVDFKEVIKSLRFYFKLGKIYSATVDKEIIGAVVFKIEQYWEGKVLIIEDLVIKEELKKKEFEKNLINFVEIYAKNNGIKSILFSTNKKSKVLKLCRKVGYKKEKDVINMGKRLK